MELCSRCREWFTPHFRSVRIVARGLQWGVSGTSLHYKVAWPPGARAAQDRTGQVPGLLVEIITD